MTPSAPSPRLRLPRPFALIAASAVLLLSAAALGAHDLFLRPDAFFVRPNSALRVLVLNGTFDGSENAVTADRLRDLRVAGPAGVQYLPVGSWRARGDTTVLDVRVGESGTYALGASLLPSQIRLEAEDFNEYLEHDGIPDVLEARRASGELDRPARERYAKHVKALVQVGEERSDDYARVFGYPAELVPLENPYNLDPGSILRVRVLVDGEPVANQLVRAGGRTAGGIPVPEYQTRSDADGIAAIPLVERGIWYVKFIHMERATNEPDLDYESKWATLTFALVGGDPGAQLRPGPMVIVGEQYAVAQPFAVPDVFRDQAEDSAAVVATVERYHAALAAGDSATALLLLTPDAVVLESGGMETRAEYRAHHLPADIEFARAVTRERGPIRVTVRGDAAWAASTSTTVGEFRGRKIDARGAELMVLTRSADGWKISAIHWSSRSAPTPR